MVGEGDGGRWEMSPKNLCFGAIDSFLRKLPFTSLNMVEQCFMEIISSFMVLYLIWSCYRSIQNCVLKLINVFCNMMLCKYDTCRMLNITLLTEHEVICEQYRIGVRFTYISALPAISYKFILKISKSRGNTLNDNHEAF